MLILILGLALLAGCSPARVPLADATVDPLPQQFVVPPEVAHLYVVRPPQDFGSAVLFGVRLGNHVLSALAPGTYHRLVLPPGRHLLVVTSPANVAQADVEAQPGALLFYQLQARMETGTARVMLRLLGPSEGRQAVQASTLAR